MVQDKMCVSCCTSERTRLPSGLHQTARTWKGKKMMVIVAIDDEEKQKEAEDTQLRGP